MEFKKSISKVKEKKYTNYAVIKLGSETADIVTFQNGKPVSNSTVSAFNGSLVDSIRHNCAGIKDVFLCFSQESTIVLDDIESAPIANENISLNLPIEFKDYIVADKMDEYVYDFKILEEKKLATGTLDSLLLSAVALKNKDFINAVETVKKAGLNPVKVYPEIDGFKSIIKSSYLNGHTNTEYFCFLYADNYKTNIKIFHGDNVIFERDIDTGVSELESAFLREIERTFDRFSIDIPEATLHNVYIMGPAAINKDAVVGIADAVEGIPVKPISELIPSVDAKTACLYTSLIGLSLIEYNDSQKPDYTFIVTEKKGVKMPTVIGLIVAVIAIVLVGKFGILDVLNEYDSKQSELKNIEEETVMLVNANKPFDETQSKYNHYSYEYLSESEAMQVSMIDSNDILQKYIFPYVTVLRFSASNNVLSMGISNSSVNYLEKLYVLLMGFDAVNNVSYGAASSTEKIDERDDYKEVTSSLTVVLNPAYILANGTDMPKEEPKEEETTEEIKAPEGDFSLDEIAWQVINGLYGNAPIRFDLLEAKGYNAREVQNKVDELYYSYNVENNGAASAYKNYEKDLNSRKEEQANVND